MTKVVASGDGKRFSVAGGGSHATLLHEVLRDCAVDGVKTAPVLANDVLHLLELNPESTQCIQGRQDLQASRERTNKLRAACVRFLLDRKSPELAAIRVRIAFDRKYRSPDAVAAEQSAMVESQLAPLLSGVLEDDEGSGKGVGISLGTAVGSTRAQNERLYLSMVAAAVLRSGLGNPADASVMKEATAAMQSVYPAREIPHFLRLPRAERREQLLEVSDITAGVRIFNWHCRKSGHGLSDLPGIVLAAGATVVGLLRESLAAVESELWPLTSALEVVVLNDACKISGELEDLVKNTIVFLRQHQVYYRRMLSDVQDTRDQARKLVQQLEADLNEVHNAVQSRTAIPTNQVYPKFMSLARTWQSLETQGIVISKATNLHRRLSAYCEDIATVDNTALTPLLVGKSSPTDAERCSAIPKRSLHLQAARCRVMLPGESVLDFKSVPLQWRGFCPWFGAVSCGGLIPGYPDLGLCELEGKYYAFSSPEAIEEFASDPTTWLLQALCAVRCRPALVGFLGLQDQLLPLRSMQVTESDALLPPICNAAVQTEQQKHPIHQGLQGSHTQEGGRKRSTATQTSYSAYRRTASAQTFPSKEAGVQCVRHVSCSAPPVSPHALVDTLWLPSQTAASRVLSQERENNTGGPGARPGDTVLFSSGGRILPQLSVDQASERCKEPIPATSFLELSAESREGSISRAGSSLSCASATGLLDRNPLYSSRDDLSEDVRSPCEDFSAEELPPSPMRETFTQLGELVDGAAGSWGDFGNDADKEHVSCPAEQQGNSPPSAACSTMNEGAAINNAEEELGVAGSPDELSRPSPTSMASRTSSETVVSPPLPKANSVFSTGAVVGSSSSSSSPSARC